LAALPKADLERLQPHLKWVHLPRGHILYESGGSVNHVYFPSTCVVSLQSQMIDGAAAEISVVGNEGVIGVPLFMGGRSTPSNAVVEIKGEAFQLNAPTVLDEFNRRGTVQNLLLLYTQALLTQIAQTAACYRHHSIDQQICRWLLLNLDRLHTRELMMTQEQIANSLGIRRESVTEVAVKLQKDQLIGYSRGRISVLNRAGLEHRACECYQVIKQEYARLLPAASPLTRATPTHRQPDSETI
jgi:CRP-like cAMP-binding protein